MSNPLHNPSGARRPSLTHLPSVGPPVGYPVSQARTPQLQLVLAGKLPPLAVTEAPLHLYLRQEVRRPQVHFQVLLTLPVHHLPGTPSSAPDLHVGPGWWISGFMVMGLICQGGLSICLSVYICLSIGLPPIDGVDGGIEVGRRGDVLVRNSPRLHPQGVPTLAWR